MSDDDNSVMIFLLIALLVVNLIISGITLSKLKKNKDGYAYGGFNKQIASSSTGGSVITQ